MKPDFLELFRALDRAGVEHVIVGGVAAILEGAPVATLDLDIVYRPDDDNLRRLTTLLDELGRARNPADLGETQKQQDEPSRHQPGSS